MERREFFRRLSGQKQATRPPYALPEETFYSQCDGCNACTKACPQNIIQLASGFPIINFNQAGCTFCGHCAAACDRGALDGAIDLEKSWQWRAQIKSTCLDKRGVVCRACEASCEEDAIKFRPALGGKTDVFILLKACTGCGVCVFSCPNNAIDMKIPDSNPNSLIKEAVV